MLQRLGKVGLVLSLGLVLAGLAGCAHNKPKGPVNPVQKITRTSEGVDVYATLYGQKVRAEANPDNILSQPLGSKKNPVRAYMPAGQRAYLKRLRCPDKKRPTYFRLGSYGAGPWGNIIDGYEVQCSDGVPRLIYMDMYHPDYRESEPVEGFTIKR